MMFLNSSKIIAPAASQINFIAQLAQSAPILLKAIPKAQVETVPVFMNTHSALLVKAGIGITNLITF